MIYQGSCHCGETKFSIEGEIGPVAECNCSICSRKGYLLWFVPRVAVQLKTPETGLATYTFNKHKIEHKFCRRCGCAPFGFGTSPSGEASAAINVRCLEGIELADLKRIPFDGKSL